MSPTLLTRPADVLDGRRLDPSREAHQPPESDGRRRDGVRLLVSDGLRSPRHLRFTDLPDALDRGDLIVANDSATIPAAVDGRIGDGSTGPGRPVRVHLSSEITGGLWLVELRLPTGAASAPLTEDVAGPVHLPDGGRLDVLARFADSRRLWFATLDLPEPTLAYLGHHGRAIHYGHVARPWPIEAYQSVWSSRPGSAEMPSAARPFTPEVVAGLADRGVRVATLTLHTGVASLEGDEAPYPEQFTVSAATAAAVRATRAAGHRVVAVGTTVVRALESAVDPEGEVQAATGWTDLVITPARGVRAVDGLVTGWHEPEASHLLMLEAIAGDAALRLAYGEAFARRYRWHEFGDSHLILPERPKPEGS